uniref:TACC_C domain-containing protein n=1 Tax=Steinernema glaseri TaxID=37863 RepID=A0A1I7Z954_9BILA
MDLEACDADDEVKLVRMCGRLTAGQIQKLQSQIEATDKDISNHLTGKSYIKRKEEQKALIGQMVTAKHDALKAHNDATEKMLEFSRFLHDYSERVIRRQKEVEELLQKVEAFEKIRDQSIVAVCMKKAGTGPLGNLGKDGSQPTPIKKLSPKSRAAEAEAAYEKEKRLLELSEKASLTQHKEAIIDYESFYEQFKSSLSKH